jgi:N-carbamoyl-L-amino-acid hydrolase
VSEAAVVTCGRLDTYPGGTNVVPGLVRVALDFRDPDSANLAMLGERLAVAARSAASTHDVTLGWHPEPEIAPVSLDPRIQAVIEASAKGRSLSTVSMPSGAGHDSQNMATIAPTGVIFVPSKGGRSHSPAEDTGWSDVENGANVLLSTLIELATARDPVVAAGPVGRAVRRGRR